MEHANCHCSIQMIKEKNQVILVSVSSGSGSKLSVIINDSINDSVVKHNFVCVDRIEKVYIFE